MKTVAASKTVVKPTAIEGVYSYDLVIAYLEATYGFDQYNFSMDEGRHYDKWCDARGYTERKKDPEGKHRSSSQIWFAEYRNDPEGMDKEPPIENFWHWLLEFIGRDNVMAKTPFTLPVGRMLDTWDTEVAPVMQLLYDKQNAAVVAGIERAIPDPEVRRQVLQSYKPKSALLPGYVTSIMTYMRREFGETVKLRGPERG